jgi:hypothetical protein
MQTIDSRAELLCRAAARHQLQLEAFNADQPNMGRHDFEDWTQDLLHDLSTIAVSYSEQAGAAHGKGDPFAHAVLTFRVQYLTAVMNQLYEAWLSRWHCCDYCRTLTNPYDDVDVTQPCGLCGH